jgi:hypothetical protein
MPFANNQLTNAVIPNTITTISDGMFSGNRLTSVDIPNGVTTIGDYAFHGNNLTALVIPNSVTTIGDHAFLNNNLTTLVIPDSVTKIGSRAFDGQKIYKITIGANVDIGKECFPGYPGFDSCYNMGKKSGVYVYGDGEWGRGITPKKRWRTIGVLLGLVPLIGGFATGHWLIGIIIAVVTALLGTVVLPFARVWGIIGLALIGGGIALGIHVGHPIILGIIGIVFGLGIIGAKTDK